VESPSGNEEQNDEQDEPPGHVLDPIKRCIQDQLQEGLGLDIESEGKRKDRGKVGQKKK